MMNPVPWLQMTNMISYQGLVRTFLRMSYSYGMFESPVVDPQQGMNAAKARCAAWGYSGAEPFGGFTSQCSQPSSSGCMQTLVTIEYQCTGDIKK
ncbi:YecR-like lipofamily protein [Escherichia coli]|nr:YecR family lipoprotein [Escherichia coli]UNF04014.1 YecR-like lipofamily protein [Escherichia coli]